MVGQLKCVTPRVGNPSRCQLAVLHRLLLRVELHEHVTRPTWRWLSFHKMRISLKTNQTRSPVQTSVSVKPRPINAFGQRPASFEILPLTGVESESTLSSRFVSMGFTILLPETRKRPQRP